jgi:hypothetical protein
MQDQMQPDNNLPQQNVDHEGAMAKADLFKLANYSVKLFKQIEDGDQLEGWVQAKITKAADYVASVYHYLEYEMKFNEYGEHLANAEVMTEGQTILKGKLMEAKAKVKELKKLQAEKLKDKKKVAEGILSGGEETCSECGGSGMIYREATPVPDHVKTKVEKYKRQTKAFHAAGKRIDRNKNGIPDDEEVGENLIPVPNPSGASSAEDAKRLGAMMPAKAGEKDPLSTKEGFDEKSKVGDTKKTRTGELTKTSTGVVHKNTSYHDDGEAEDKSGKGIKSHAKSQSAAEKKEKAPAQKMSPKSAKTWGMKDSEKFDNRDGAPAKPKKEKAVDEMYGQGVYEAKLKGKQSKLDVDQDGDIEADDLADLRSGKKDKKVDEAKGKKPDFLDMDKDGDKKEPMKKAVADKKKNPFAKKESIESQAEVMAESTDLTRMRQLMTRLNG